jgi:catalase
MINYFTQADPDYGKRVKEGLEKAKDAIHNHTSSEAADVAMNKAKEMGHESDRY